MKTFYTPHVDIANTKSMWQFLKDHFTYSTLNSWNGMKSIAHNVKLYNLDLEGDWTIVMNFLYDNADSGCLQMFIDDEMQEFTRNNSGYRVGFNGRSGGYLVLYNADNFRSILPDCVDDYCDYEEFKKEIRSYGQRVTDFDYELRQAVEVVREFDKLCDRLCALVNEYSKKSYEISKLEDAVERFNCEYGDDLSDLALEGPEIELDHVNLNDISNYNAFMNCFYQCLGEDSRRAYVNGNQLYLKED